MIDASLEEFLAVARSLAMKKSSGESTGGMNILNSPFVNISNVPYALLQLLRRVRCISFAWLDLSSCNLSRLNVNNAQENTRPKCPE